MDRFGDTASLVSSALVIGLILLFRRLLAQRKRSQARGSSTGIIFSLEKGDAWASFSGSDAPMRLGPQAEVEKMMHDFLAQLEVGRRLAG